MYTVLCMENFDLYLGGFLEIKSFMVLFKIIYLRAENETLRKFTFLGD